MARNEEGEFELILGNRQLLSVFFLVVLLLGLCFVGGYVLGRSAAPVLTATTVPPQQESPKTVASAPQPTPAAKEEAPTAAPVQTAPQAAPDPEPPAPKPEPVKPKAEPPKPEPAKLKAEAPKAVAPKAAAKLTPPTSAPIPGRIYLQLSATDKDKADTMVDLLRSRNLPGSAAPIPDRPGLFRVLVGPVAESGVQDMRAKLKSAGFPADQAIKRTF